MFELSEANASVWKCEIEYLCVCICVEIPSMLIENTNFYCVQKKKNDIGSNLKK